MATQDEVLDPGPPIHADVAFVRVRHAETGGEADVPPHLVAHHSQRGWEQADSPVVVEPDLELDTPDEDPEEPDLAEPDEAPKTTSKRRPARKAQED